MTDNDTSIEDIVLENLILNEDFTRQSIPFIKDEYFSDNINRCIFRTLNDYFRKNSRVPHKSILLIETKEDSQLSYKESTEVSNIISKLYSADPQKDLNWLLESAEKWCQDRDMYLSIVKSLSIYDGSDKTMLPSVIPDLMKSSLAVSFKTEIGIDWIIDAEDRYDRYSIPQNKIPFDLEILNDITLGGVTRKTLSMILAGVHVGKTLSLVHLAARIRPSWIQCFIFIYGNG